jgi:hypothetical protein
MRRQVQLVRDEDCFTILLDRDRDALRSLVAKHHTRRRLNKLRKAGVLTFRHIETRAEADAQLSYFFQNQIRRCVLAGKESFSTTLEFRRFLQALVDEFDLTSQLRFGVLELDSRPLAWHFSFHVNGKFVFYQQTFNVTDWDYAPGEVLIHQLLLYAQDNVVRELDFTRGAEPFKNRFTTHVRKTYSLYVYRPGLRGQTRRFSRTILGSLHQLERRAKQLAKRHDKIFGAFRRVRLWANGGLARARHHRRARTLMPWARQVMLSGLDFCLARKAEMEVFLPGSEGITSSLDRSSSEFKVSPGQFGDLVDLSRQHPEVVVPSDLAQYRQRLKKGDRIQIVRRGDQVALVAWLASGRLADVLPLRPSAQNHTEGQMMLLYETWEVYASVGAARYQELLCVLGAHAENEKLVFGVCCPLTSFRLRAVLTSRGFQSRYRLIRHAGSRRYQVQTVDLRNGPVLARGASPVSEPRKEWGE